jgi:hypothetical protein
MNCLLFRTNILKTQVLASHTTNKKSLEKINKCTKEINCCCCLTGMGSFFLMILNPARFRKWIKLPYKYLIEIMTLLLNWHGFFLFNDPKSCKISKMDKITIQVFDRNYDRQDH